MYSFKKTKKQVCCFLMLALINEFSNTSRSTKLGLSNDSHFKVKRIFEQDEFKLILVFVYETTQSLIESIYQNKIISIKTLDAISKDILLQLFTLYDQSFSWEFTSSKHVLKNLIGNFTQSNLKSSNSSPLVNLEPTPEFKDFFLNPDLVKILFKCYCFVRDDSDFSHSVMQ